MKVLIVDDHPLLVEILSAVAQSVFGDASIETAGSLGVALQLAAALTALDMVLLDLGLPDCAGLTTLEQFRAAYATVPVVVISGDAERSHVVAALALGAAGFIPKVSTPPVICAALRLVASGGRYVPPEAIDTYEQAPTTNSQFRLTARQFDVLQLIGKGLRNKEIAQRLEITEDTVKRHASAVFAALGASTRVQALQAATRLGIRIA